MMQISVKTLDSQTKVFTVPDEVIYTQEAKFCRIFDKLRTTFQFYEHFMDCLLHFIDLMVRLNLNSL